jgi:pyruvate/2-oxoglutarate/acetoin dehydrogenase E1 component
MPEPDALAAVRESWGQRNTYAAGINQALHYEMGVDPTVLLMGEDVGGLGGVFGVTRGLAEAYPDRVLDTPIAEGGFAGMGVGAAMAGHPVVVEIQIIDFLLFAADQIANAGNMHFVSGGQVTIPIVFRGPCCFGAGFGVTHTQHLEAFFANRPGVRVVMPSTPADAKGLLTSAIRDPNPVVLFEETTLYFRRGEVVEDGTAIPLGVARIVREGSDVTVATAGRAVELCVAAAETLAQEDGIDLEVVDLRSLKPVDWDTLASSIGKTGSFLSAFDGPRFCSYGTFLVSEAAERCWAELKSAPRALGGIDVAAAVAQPAEALAGVTPERIVIAIRQMLA